MKEKINRIKHEDEELIFGRNPVTEALKSGREIEKILIQKGAGGSVGRILRMAKERGVPVRDESKANLDKKSAGASHQGVAAIISPYKYCPVEDILALAKKREEPPFVIILDGLEDPHNMGAIMRTAECAGAHGVIVAKRRAAGITGTVAKASAGAVEYLPCARVANIARTVDMLKEQGLWIYACDMDGDTYYKADMKGPMALVIGNEGSGISRLVKSKCDFVVSIPMRGRISSLNASSAAAILMYEIRKQRDAVLRKKL